MTEHDPAAWRQRAMAEIVRRQLAHIKAGGTTDRAPGALLTDPALYTCAERFAAEKRALFGSLPLLAGLSQDLARPGDILLFEETGVPVLLVRGSDGIARAFLNMCTHRGAKLVDACGHRTRLTCPFHAWSFALDGRLIGQPGKAGFAGIDPASRTLIPLPCAEWGGLLFIRIQPGETDLDVRSHLGPLAEVLAALELEKAEPVRASTLTAAANWKFALDTYGEGYHFATLHASTIGKTHYNDIAVFDAFGPHFRITFPDKGLATLADLPEDQWPPMDYGAVHYVYPNSVLFIGSIEPGKGYVQLFRLFPGAHVGEMFCRFAVYAPGGLRDEQHRTEVTFAHDATAQVVQTEDYRIASEGYSNLLSAPPGFRIVLGSNEIALQHLQRVIAEGCGLPL